MFKIVVGGQINKEEIAKFTEGIVGGKASVEVKSDLDAAMALKAGQYDYYVGACNTGGGGALAMAMAIAGADICATISMPGKVFPDDVIVGEVKAGKKAFGFTAQHAEQVLPVLLNAIMEKEGN